LARRWRSAQVRAGPWAGRLQQLGCSPGSSSTAAGRQRLPRSPPQTHPPALAPAAPWLIEHYSWQAVFYLFGGSAILWLPFWAPVKARSSNAAAAAGRHPQSQAVAEAAAAADVAEAQPLITRRVSAAGSEGGAGGGGAGAAGGSAGQRADLKRGRAGAGQVEALWALVQTREVWAIMACQYCQVSGGAQGCCR